MSKIVAVRKDDTGTITQYKLDDGRVLDKRSACIAVDKGEIEGCATFTTRDGDDAIRSNRGQADYKLDDLPTF